jgi:hypothetical protein
MKASGFGRAGMGRLKVKGPRPTDWDAIEAEMGYTDSTALILYRKQAYLDWTRSLPEPLEGLTLEGLNNEPPTYLIPYEDNVTHADKWVERNWAILFMEELNGWTEDSQEWPNSRTFAMFKEWFRWEWSTQVREVGPKLELSFEPTE